MTVAGAAAPPAHQAALPGERLQCFAKTGCRPAEVGQWLRHDASVNAAAAVRCRCRQPGRLARLWLVLAPPATARPPAAHAARGRSPTGRGEPPLPLPAGRGSANSAAAARTAGRTVLHHAARVDHQHAVEVPRLPDIVRHTQQRGAVPHPTGPPQQGAAFLSVEPPERLVKEDQPCVGADQGTAEPNALPLSAGEQPPALAQRRLEPVRQALEHVRQGRVLEHARQGRHGVGVGAVQQVVQQRGIPELDGRIDPRRLVAQPIEPARVERRPIDQELPRRRAVPAEQQPHQRRFAGAGGAHDGHVTARRDGELDDLPGSCDRPPARSRRPGARATPCGIAA